MLSPTLAGQFAAISIGANGGTFTGSVTFQSATYFADGTAALPGAAFAGAHGTGMYREGAALLGFSVAGVSEFRVTNGAFIVSKPIGVSGGGGYLYKVTDSNLKLSDVSDSDNSSLLSADFVSSPGTGLTPSLGTSHTVYTNSGAGAEFIVTAPASTRIGFVVEILDVGGTGGISFIAASGESVQVGLLVTSGAARKVKSTSGTGAVLKLVKATATLWVAETFIGVWVGS